jgi:hypothetical protein
VTSRGALRRFLRSLGLEPVLERAQVAERTAAALGWLSGSARQRRRTIASDLRKTERDLAPIVADVPSHREGPVAMMVSSLQAIWAVKLEGVFSLALRLAGYRVIVVETGYSPWTRRYHATFGNHEIVRFVSFLRLGERDGEHPSEPLRVGDLLGLRQRDVDVGRVALSNLITRHKFERIDLSEPRFQAAVKEALTAAARKVRAAERLLDDVRPELAVLLEKGLSPAAELFGASVSRGIPVVQYSNAQTTNEFALRRYGSANRLSHPFSLDPTSWERVKAMPWGRDREDALLEELADSYRSGRWFNRKFLHHGKRIKPAEEVRRELGLDPSRPTAVIFSHVLWDATFFYGEGLFEDYETWLLETVRAACANPRVNWVVKLHPDLTWKLKYEGHTGELRDVLALRAAVGSLPPHVTLVPPDTDIDTYSFFDVADYCLTVRGTIGIEMACHGVPVLTAGTGRYSGLGFTFDSASAAEYLSRLAAIERQPVMTAEQIELARRFAYALFKLRPWRMESFEIVKRPLEETGHPLDNDVLPRVGSAAELRRAPDVRRLLSWIRSDRFDYLELPD